MTCRWTNLWCGVGPGVVAFDAQRRGRPAGSKTRCATVGQPRRRSAGDSPGQTGPPGGRNRRPGRRFPQHHAGPHQQLQAGGRRGHVAQPAHRPQRRRRRGRSRPRQPPSHRRGPRRQGRVPIDRHRSGQRDRDGRRCRLPPRRRPRQGRPVGARGRAGPRPAGLRQNAVAPLCRFQRPSGWSCGGSCRPKRVPRRRWRCVSPRWRPRRRWRWWWRRCGWN